MPSHKAKGETTAPGKSCCPSVPCSSWHAPVPTGTQEMPKPTLQSPRAKAYKFVSPPVSLICVSWRARSLRSTATWPWLLNPYLHQDRGDSRLGYFCKP